MGSSQVRSSDRGSYTVVVSVGTDHHQFDRLVRWIDTWAASHPDTTAFVQRGASQAPIGVPSEEMVAHGDLLHLFANAAVVVSHGGPSTVMDARASGRLPIVVPRDPDRGEHVDGHQMRFADHLELHGLARLASSEFEFRELLDKAIEQPADYQIDRARADAPSGVVEFGAVVDGLLGTSTPIETDRR
jgi:UDP-N-acetylglucosamine transferase subunit ALG13